ncbi:MAG: Hsp20/alpha crystallin family protein, partial [Anaerolineaceae bacterium]|nr:Hsp20/alpha crystallin family protein [Anaerolineaceae bacterium]
MTLYCSQHPGRLAHHRMLHRWMAENRPMPEPEVIFPVNLKADKDAYTLTALLPGIKAEDLNIQITREYVTLQGEFKPDADPAVQFLLQELPAGKFNRTLALPEAVDASKAEADLADGMLTLRIPKSE